MKKHHLRRRLSPQETGSLMNGTECRPHRLLAVDHQLHHHLGCVRSCDDPYV